MTPFPSGRSAPGFPKVLLLRGGGGGGWNPLGERFRLRLIRVRGRGGGGKGQVKSSLGCFKALPVQQMDLPSKDACTVPDTAPWGLVGSIAMMKHRSGLSSGCPPPGASVPGRGGVVREGLVEGLGDVALWVWVVLSGASGVRGWGRRVGRACRGIG